MAITPEQRIARRQGIGSSEAAGWLGLDPYKRLADLVADKLGLLVRDDGESQSALIGTHFEDGIIKVLRLTKGWDVRVSPETMVRGILRANLDAQIDGVGMGFPVVEFKTGAQVHGLEDPTEVDDSGLIPQKIWVQVQHQLWCAQSPVGWMAALRTGHRGQLAVDTYRIPQDRDFCVWMEGRLTDLWERHVVHGDPVPETEAPVSEKALGRMDWRDEGKKVELPEDLVTSYHDAKSKADALYKESQEIKERILGLLKSSDARKGTAGRFSITYPLCKGKEAFDAEALKKDHPDLWKKYHKVGLPYPMFRVTEMKNAS